MVGVRDLFYGGAVMVNGALRPIGHLTAWLVWHSMRVSLLDDIDALSPPARSRGLVAGE